MFLLLPIRFAFVGATAGLYARGMHFNVSTGVGLATVFAGRTTLLGPARMTSLAAISGLLPASIATGLGSDAQRPLATVLNAPA